MAEIVYILCMVTSLLCACLLWRGYKESRTPLLFWSSLCFAGFALNNFLLFLDLVIFPEISLAEWRILPALLGVGALIYGILKKEVT